MKKYKKRKKYPGKMTKLEMLKFENERLKWDIDKIKNESDNWQKLTILFIFIWLVTVIFY